VYQQPWYPQQHTQTQAGFDGFGQHQQQQPFHHQQQPTQQPGNGQFPFMQQQAFPQQQLQVPPMPPAQFPTPPAEPGMLPLEMSFIENILRLNRGKIGTFYFTYEQNVEWNARVYRGRVEEAGRDHIILSDPETGQWYLLLMVNFDYAVFDEELEYDYPFNDVPPLVAFPPRPDGSDY
jgi:spore germination protein Q